MVVLLMLIGAGLIYWIVERLYAKYWNKGLTADLRFSTDHAVKGECIDLIEVVANRKYLPLPYIYVKFQVDKSLVFSEIDGNSAISDLSYRNDVFSLLYYQQAVRKIPVRCTKRGVYRIHQIQMVSTGAFMNDVLACNMKQNAVITVYPEAADTERLWIPFQQMMGTIERNRHLYEDKFVFRGIRDYESYDSMSQINWKATARSGQFMVNQYNESVCQEVCILLNLEPEGVIRQEILSEESISIAAGLVQMFVEQGIQTSLISNGRDADTQEEIFVQAGSGLSHLNAVNTVLAGINLAIPVREFVEVLEEIEAGKYGSDYQNEFGSGNTMYVIISENKRDNLKEQYQKLSGNSGVWIVPYLKEDSMNLEAGNIQIIEWEVDMHG